jgi:sulfur carrier protein ThiS
LKIIVKLFGTLEQNFTGYDSLKGIEVNISDGASVKDLLAHLDILETKGYFVCMNNCIVTDETQLINDAKIIILQALAGG